MAMVIAPQLRALREAQALTQQQLADQAGVSLRTVVRIETGYPTRPPTIKKLAEALDVRPITLTRGDKEVPPSR